jgi:hypothetical protein
MGCTVEFKLYRDENRGIYYDETNRCLIYLPMHETIEDVYKTISHEVFHYCLEASGVQLDEEQEEKLIFNIQWAEIAL